VVVLVTVRVVDGGRQLNARRFCVTTDAPFCPFHVVTAPVNPAAVQSLCAWALVLPMTFGTTRSAPVQLVAVTVALSLRDAGTAFAAVAVICAVVVPALAISTRKRQSKRPPAATVDGDGSHWAVALF
jgi:hypothetical protein